MSEKIPGSEAVSLRSRPKPEDETLTLSEAGRIREAANELVRRYVHEDRTSLIKELQNSSVADLLDMAIGLKLSVANEDYNSDEHKEMIAIILGEFCLRLATSRSI